MQPHKGKKLALAVAGAALIAGAGPALGAGFPNSGGPGGLGTEVPFDSRLAREYFNYHLPTNTPEALQLRDEVQAVHAGDQAAVELGRLGAGSQAVEVRAFAARLAEEQRRIDGALVDVARDSLLDLSGAAYEGATQANADVLRDVQAATGHDRDARFVAAAVKLLEAHAARVDALRPQAKEARRQQLGSVLDREQKLLQGELATARGLSSKVASR